MISELPADIYREIVDSSYEASAVISSIAEIRPTGIAVVELDAISQEMEETLGTANMDRLYKHTFPLNQLQFSSYFYQLKTFASLPRSEVQEILEIGPGAGILTALLRQYGYSVQTMDISGARNPDFTGSVTDIPADDDSYGVVCAFEVLQHLPYEKFVEAMAEMARCARSAVFISLPYPAHRAGLRAEIDVKLPFRGWRKISFGFDWKLPWKPGDRSPRSLDDFRAHHWEVNRSSYPERRVHEDISKAGLKIIETFHNSLHPYHYFILCEPIKV